MKKITATLTLAAAMTVSLSGCVGWDSIATVDGGTGWYAGDYAPYYWSNWNLPPSPPLIGNGPGSLRPSYYPPANRPGSMRPGAPGNTPPPGNPGNNIGNRPTPPPSIGNGPGSNPGSPQQGGFRGEK